MKSVCDITAGPRHMWRGQLRLYSHYSATDSRKLWNITGHISPCQELDGGALGRTQQGREAMCFCR